MYCFYILGDQTETEIKIFRYTLAMICDEIWDRLQLFTMALFVMCRFTLHKAIYVGIIALSLTEGGGYCCDTAVVDTDVRNFEVS